MGNKLFQKAREMVRKAENSEAGSQTAEKAQNALSSAYAQSSDAERGQLKSLQDDLNQLK
ncbi:DUF3813 domain-containing protein [Metabacillus sp. GX 13764]|uniref:DUF3813 domain-containing protein n=1 Tax=Metabacillus kandeliae TaxID=2900151 RepID=UPI001E4CF464|nr:DUF3813 domain-containing protein [Metabacillus kandeliae]MCD7034943.1 DUF3813 domain-containing protein [Metabacillus kandeliae]